MAQALAAFHLALNLPRHFDDNHSREWHTRLVVQAKRLLELREIAFEEAPIGDGLTQLVIAPLKGKSHLNDFAFDVAHNLGGIAFVYSPKDLLKPEGRARASFHREKNRILLPKGFLDHPRIDDAIYHEVLHAVFHDLLKNGVGSLFHGWVRSLDRKQPMWKSQQYRFRMSLEELATHALNLHLIGEDWNLALQNGEAEVAAALQRRLRMKASTLCAIGTEAAGVLERALIELELGGALRLEWNPGADALVAPILWARLTFESIEVKLPLLSSDGDTWLRWQRHLVEARDPEVADEIAAQFRRRIEMQRKVAGQVAAQAETVLRALQALDGKPPESERIPSALWDALCAPRLLTFQYLRWG